MSDETRILAGTLLLALVTVESGGFYLLKIARGKAPATPFQERFARAGHAHAGVLLVLALVVLLYVDATGMDGFWGWVARSGVPIAALLLPGGFFFCSMGRGRTEPNRFVVMLPAGAVMLALGLAATGVGLLTAG